MIHDTPKLNFFKIIQIHDIIVNIGQNFLQFKDAFLEGVNLLVLLF